VAVLSENTMLGPYRIASVIGEGGMGAVYKAQDTRLGRDVAIKVLTAVTMNDRERLLRFEQEARATGMLNHPNLLTIFDVGNTDGTPYLVSELLQGETLRERLGRGPVPPRKSVEIALQVAHGLGAAHEKGIVHRDLKPENIFLGKDGRVKILDFGIAKLNPVTGRDGPTFQMAATEPGMVLGTVGYMSPEQVRGENVDARSDIFAFGAILYEMLSGARAFKRNSSIETLGAILKEEPPDLIETMPNVPPTLERLVRRCLEKDRDHRFQSARDLAFNLETMTSFSSGGTLPGTVTHATAAHTARQAADIGGSPTTRGAALTGTQARMTATSATAAMPARTRTVGIQKKKQRINRALLVLLYIVSVAGAGWGAWTIANRLNAPKGEVAFKRVTFRRGELRGARFAPDGDTLIYSASWEGLPPEVFIGNRRSPEARPLEIPEAEILAVSRSTELAILLRRDRITGLGTLARVPLAGGMPREIADNVLQADWTPDGQLGIIRQVRNRWRLESPIGTVKYETQHDIRDLRISPDGKSIAFIEPHGGANDLVIIRDGAPDPIARGWNNGATGLAWSPDGRELWISGTDTSDPPSLQAVALTGEKRLISRLTGSMKLYDISPQGRVLLSNGHWRAALLHKPPGESVERDMAWLDWSMLADLSADGKSLLFNETREGGGNRQAIYLRRIDAPAPIHLGDGFGDGLSTDGKWILAHHGAKLMLLPAGSGDAREVKVPGNFELGAAWMPDSRRVVLAGAQPKGAYRLLLVDTLDETVTPLSPENIAGGGVRPFAVSPDGRYVAGMTAEETIALYPTDGSLQSIAVGSAEKGEVPIAWSADNSAIYVYRPTALPARVIRISLATGARELWKEFAPSDPAGIYKISPVLITPDGSSYAYNALRTTSDLYVAEGLK
jgi:hypothetical protein